MLQLKQPGGHQFLVSLCGDGVLEFELQEIEVDLLECGQWGQGLREIPLCQIPEQRTL